MHSISLFPLHSFLKGFRLSHACFVHSISLFPLHSLFKGFRLSHACHTHSVLFLPMQSLLASFWRSLTDLVQLIFNFPSWFHTISFHWSHTFHSFLSQITLCFSFGSKDMIPAFTCLLSYRYSSFTLWALPLLEAYLQSFCQWPIIELAKNVSPKWEQNGRYPCGPDTFACAFSTGSIASYWGLDKGKEKNANGALLTESKGNVKGELQAEKWSKAGGALLRKNGQC